MKLLIVLSAFLFAGVPVFSMPASNSAPAPAPAPASFQEGNVVSYNTPMKPKVDPQGNKVKWTKKHPAIVLDNGAANAQGVVHHNIAETSHSLPKKKYKHQRSESEYNVGDGAGSVSMRPKNVPATELSHRNGAKVTPQNMQKLKQHMASCQARTCKGCIARRSLGSACALPSRAHAKTTRAQRIRPAKKVGSVRHPVKTAGRKVALKRPAAKQNTKKAAKKAAIKKRPAKGRK